MCPTSAQVMISQFVSSSPTSGSVLTAQSLEPASDSVSLSVSLCPSITHTLSLSLKNKHKTKKVTCWLNSRSVWGHLGVMILCFCEIEPLIRLCADNAEPAWDSLPLSLFPCPPCALSLSVSKKENKRSQCWWCSAISLLQTILPCVESVSEKGPIALHTISPQGNRTVARMPGSDFQGWGWRCLGPAAARRLLL